MDYRRLDIDDIDGDALVVTFDPSGDGSPSGRG